MDADPDGHDGRRAGPADADGSPHCCQGHDRDQADECRVRPANQAAAALECEPWSSFAF
ncbi:MULTISPECIES: hypothetical protein [Streptomyces]|uniref:hypothetical protein n=1 Tax=Streptomyces TaxID=1883 RepID=UPI000A968056|nr:MULTISPECIES: hypothetical protein [Streptomyces]